MCKSFCQKGRNEGPEAPPDMELGDSYAVGARGYSDSVRHRLLRKRCGESDPAAVDCAWFGEGDRRPSGIADDFDPMALAANHAEGLGDSRARAAGDATFVFGRRSTGEIAGRFLLGPKSVAQRSFGQETAGTHSNCERWIEQRTGSQAIECFQERSSRIALRSPSAPRENRRRMGAVQ